MIPLSTQRAEIPRLKRESLRHKIQEALIARILTGALRPGSRINESQLSRSLGVSQTPVREGLLGLEGQGFLVSRPAKGFFVREFSNREVRDTYPVLAELETMALKAAGIPPVPVLDDLAGINERFGLQVRRPDRSIELDDRFHGKLISLCPNRYLIKLIEQARRAIFRYEYAYMRDGGHISGSARQHERIIKSLRAGRLNMAIRQLRSNWLAGVEDVMRWLDERESMETES